jgi:type IV fimbrial biogenesis protein FimT
MVKNNRISGQASDFTTALMLARSEAVRRGSIVCVKSKGSAGNWNAGWDVFPEKSGETNCATVPTDKIQTHDTLSGSHTLTVGDPFKTYIRFNALGVAVDANGNPAGSVDFTLCRGTTAKDIANSRLITISATGHPMIKVDSTTGSPKPPTSCP